MSRHATGRKRKPDPYATVVVFSIVLTTKKAVRRRIAIRSDQSLDDLHAAIFDAFGRLDEHLYSFHLQPLYDRRSWKSDRENVEYTSPLLIEEARLHADHDVRDASKTRIAEVASGQDVCVSVRRRKIKIIQQESQDDAGSCSGSFQGGGVENFRDAYGSLATALSNFVHASATCSSRSSKLNRAVSGMPFDLRQFPVFSGLVQWQTSQPSGEIET